LTLVLSYTLMFVFNSTSLRISKQEMYNVMILQFTFALLYLRLNKWCDTDMESEVSCKLWDKIVGMPSYNKDCYQFIVGHVTTKADKSQGKSVLP